MNRLQDIVARIKQVTDDSEISDATEIFVIEECIKGYATDILNLFKNIRDTSLPGNDYDSRITDLCSRFGITQSGNKFY